MKPEQTVKFIYFIAGAFVESYLKIHFCVYQETGNLFLILWRKGSQEDRPTTIRVKSFYIIAATSHNFYFSLIIYHMRQSPSTKEIYLGLFKKVKAK